MKLLVPLLFQLDVLRVAAPDPLHERADRRVLLLHEVLEFDHLLLALVAVPAAAVVGTGGTGVSWSRHRSVLGRRKGDVAKRLEAVINVQILTSN